MTKHAIGMYKLVHELTGMHNNNETNEVKNNSEQYGHSKLMAI